GRASGAARVGSTNSSIGWKGASPENALRRRMRQAYASTIIGKRLSLLLAASRRPALPSDDDESKRISHSSDAGAVISVSQRGATRRRPLGSTTRKEW